MRPVLDDDLLPAATLERMGGLEISARVLAREFRSGVHRSPFSGSGEEFDRHRPYQQGDDLRHLDWRLYARTDRPHLRLYRERVAHPTWLLLDSSASMGFSGGERVSKLRWGVHLAAALTHLLLEEGDPVGIGVSGEEPLIRLPLRRRQGHREAAFELLAGLAAAGIGSTADLVEEAGTRLPRSGRIVLLSDLLVEGEERLRLVRALAAVRARGGESIALRISDPVELGEEAMGGGVFEDPERPGIRVPSSGSPELLRERVERYYRELEGELTARGVEVAAFRTDEPLLGALTGWLGGR